MRNKNAFTFFFCDRVSLLRISGCPRTCCVGQAGHQPRGPPVSAWIKGVHHHAQPHF